MSGKPSEPTLPPIPTSLQQLVLADLERAQQLIIKHHAELDPQWRIASPNGDYYLATHLQANPELRTSCSMQSVCSWPGNQQPRSLVQPSYKTPEPCAVHWSHRPSCLQP
jgi:hypothetical protein